MADEGHTFLKNKDTQIFAALTGILTKRRVALTGSPIQNNLGEYYRMVSWVRPGVLGYSEAEFNREYRDPIETGLASDASPIAVRESNDASRKLHNVLAPYVQRKDATVLRKDLPPMQQVVLHVRQTKAQVHLYRAFQRYKKRNNVNNFFTSYQMIRPLHNHPSTLLMNDDAKQKSRKPKAAAKAAPSSESATVPKDSEADVAVVNSKPTGPVAGATSADPSSVPDASEEKNAVSIDSKDCPSSTETATDGEETDTESRCVVSTASRPPTGRPKEPSNTEWWRKTVERMGGAEKMKEVEHGYKVVLLLHILMEAQAVGDKVVVFSQCLRTLDFIEYVLGLENWAKHVPSLASSSASSIGGWKKGLDYLRIDGQTQFGERGDLVAQFNDEESSLKGTAMAPDGQVKAFLLSAQACGIGINLIAANRVVLFDNHFNPTIQTQCIFRCYRYGQTKPVYAYRFMTEGTVRHWSCDRVVVVMIGGLSH